VKIRADIAELLHQGVPQTQIARQLHVAPLTVQKTREALGRPSPKMRRILPTTIEEVINKYTHPTDGGHVEWTGPLRNGCPSFVFEGQHYYARRLVFGFEYEREPVGNVTAVCGVPACVAGRCVQDRPMRQREKRVDSLYAWMVGGAS
jgi:hypothetical protein